MLFVHAFYKAITTPVFFLAAGTGNLLVCHHVVAVADFIPQLGGAVQFFCGFGVRRHVVARTYRAVVSTRRNDFFTHRELPKKLCLLQLVAVVGEKQIDHSAVGTQAVFLPVGF